MTRKGERKQAWIVDYFDQGGQRHIKTFERKREAEAEAANTRINMRAGVHTSSKATVAEAGDQMARQL